MHFYQVSAPMQTEVFCGEYVHLPFLRVKLSFQGRETLKKKRPYPPRKTSVLLYEEPLLWNFFHRFSKKSKKSWKKFFRRISGENRKMCGLSAATPCGPPELQLKCLKEVCGKKAVCFGDNAFYTGRIVCSERKKAKLAVQKGCNLYWQSLYYTQGLSPVYLKCYWFFYSFQ